MRERERADDFDQVPERRDGQSERGDEEEMIIARQDVHDAVPDVILRHASLVNARPGAPPWRDGV